MKPSDFDIPETLGRIEAKLDSVIEDKADHEQRIRTLEKRSWQLAGAGGVLGALGAWFAKHF